MYFQEVIFQQGKSHRKWQSSDILIRFFTCIDNLGLEITCIWNIFHVYIYVYIYIKEDFLCADEEEPFGKDYIFQLLAAFHAFGMFGLAKTILESRCCYKFSLETF